MFNSAAAVPSPQPSFTGAQLPLKPMHVWGIRVQLMARACGAREETAFDRSFDDFVRHNDLP